MRSDVADKLCGSTHRVREASFHAVRNRQKVQVVIVVHHGIHARRARQFEIVFVGFSCIHVAARGLVVISDAHVDVRGHVHEMTGGGNLRGKFRHVRQSTLRMRRGFDGVDVVMNRADVIRIAFEDGFEHADNFFRAFGRLAVIRPELPRAQVHQAFGVERRGIKIIWILLHERVHRILVINRQLLQISFRISRISFHQRANVSALVLRRER